MKLIFISFKPSPTSPKALAISSAALESPSAVMTAAFFTCSAFKNHLF